jgi:hypothetical protein
MYLTLAFASKTLSFGTTLKPYGKCPKWGTLYPSLIRCTGPDGRSRQASQKNLLSFKEAANDARL